MAASLILSTRSARFIGLRLMAWIRSRLPTMKPACGPPSNLSPENVTTSAVGRRLPSCRLRLQPVLREVDQRARPEIVGERNARLLGDGAELRRPDLGREALNAVVRRVDLEYQPGPFVQRRAIILLMRAIGRADLDQSRARARHDFRHAKRAANLDELAARHDHLATGRKRVQHKQHCGGIVVDDRRVLRAGQIA